MSFLVRASPSSLFPTFLLPAIPFRRKSSADSTSSTQSSTSPESTPAHPQPSSTTRSYLSNHVSYLRCGRCAADLCLTSAIVSRGFTGRWGRAYLVSASGHSENQTAPNTALSTRELNALPNTHIHRPVPRQLVTGGHTVSDVSCAFCGNVLGWKYVAAEEESQRYKVGKFILETKRVSVMADWEQAVVGGGGGEGRAVVPDGVGMGDEAQFDSQDEDECEDLFAGVWTPALAAKRRQSRRFSKDVR